MKLIPQIQPWIDYKELEYLTKVVDSTYVTEHELTEEFENRIKQLTGAKHAVAVCNGTAALYCCLKSLGIGRGDEVIVPNLTFIATANAVIMAGATPVFCDVDEHTLSLDLSKASLCLSPRTAAIMPVHLYGHSSKMDSILSFAEHANLKVVEDAAQGVGVLHKGQHVGTFGDMGILSFYGNKTMTCGEGGIILTDDDELRDRCYRLKNHGRLTKGVFIHDTIGFNFSFTELQAAVGLSQLDKLPKIIDTKQDIYEKYVSGLKERRYLFPPLKPDVDEVPVHWFSSFVAPSRKCKEDLKKFLLSKNIQTRDFFYPLDLQPCYKEIVKLRCSMNASHLLYNRGLSLPSSCNLKAKDQNRVIKGINDFFMESK